MKLTYPIRPVAVNQPFGGNAAYYARFKDKCGNPERGHMGIDFMAAHGQPVYACHDGFAFYVGPDEHGGDGVYLRFEDEDHPGTYYTAIYWHLCAIDDPIYKPKVEPIGRDVKRGDILGYADNSGAPFESTGDHLHFGLAKCDSYGNFIEPCNGFGGCVDPAPFLVSPAIINAPEPEDRIGQLAADQFAAGLVKQAGWLRAIVAVIKAFGKS